MSESSSYLTERNLVSLNFCPAKLSKSESSFTIISIVLRLVLLTSYIPLTRNSPAFNIPTRSPFCATVLAKVSNVKV